MSKHISNIPVISSLGCRKQNSLTGSKTQHVIVSGILFLCFSSFHLKQNFKILCVFSRFLIISLLMKFFLPLKLKYIFAELVWLRTKDYKT